MNFIKDYNFGVDNEDKVVKYLDSLGYKIEKNGKTNIFDFNITFKKKKVNIELKTRRCEKDTYPDTLIGANKLAESWNKYYSKGEETLFFFSYKDGLYYINPLNITPRRDFILQRWDRGIDKPKGWVYYNTKDLKKII